MPKVKLVPLTQLDSVNDSIKPARSVISDWYKESPRRLEGYEHNLCPAGVSTATYKQCAPFLDGMTVGYMAVLTSDIEVTIGENNLPSINHKPLGRTIVSLHSAEQWGGMPYPAFHYPAVFKWEQDLIINTPKNYSVLFTHPMNRFDLPFTTISGVVDADHYFQPTHFPFFLKQGFVGVIEAGTPVCQIVPFQRENWDRSLQPFDPVVNANNSDNYAKKIIRAYKNNIWQKKHYN